jgi:hypothetical protein
MPSLEECFICLLNRAVSIGGLLKKGKEPLTAVATWARDKPRKILKQLGFQNKRNLHSYWIDTENQKSEL